MLRGASVALILSIYKETCVMHVYHLAITVLQVLILAPVVLIPISYKEQLVILVFLLASIAKQIQ